MTLTIDITPAQRQALAPAFAEIARLHGTLGLRPGALIAQVHEDFALVWVLDHARALAVERALEGQR